MAQAAVDQTGTIKPLTVDTDALATLERFDFLNDVYAKEGLILAPRTGSRSKVSAGSSLWQLGNVRFAVTYSSGHIGRRVRSTGNPVLAIRKHTSGGCHSWSEDGHFATQPGDMILTINSVDGVHACHELETTNLVLPLELLDADPRGAWTTRILRRGTLENRLLSVAFEEWRARLSNLSATSLGLVESEIVGLVNYILGNKASEQAQEAQSRCRSQAIRAYIDEFLLSKELTADQLSAEFGASRASIYREFSQDGGLRRYVSARRLKTALMLLNSGPHWHGRVGEVARTVGYDDPLHFSRAFRKEFGFSPKEALSLVAFAK